jgi:hypothetical protein
MMMMRMMTTRAVVAVAGVDAEVGEVEVAGVDVAVGADVVVGVAGVDAEVGVAGVVKITT